jgi:hypothetical protein
MAGETIKMRTILEGTTAQRIRPANVRFRQERSLDLAENENLTGR